MLAIGTILRSWLRLSLGRGRTRDRRIVRPERARVIVLLFGWTLATGAHWDVLQVAAWGRMWVTYARVQPLAAALETTLSPAAMCGACRTIQAAKRDQAGNPAVDLSAVEKAFLLLPTVRPLEIETPPPLHFARAADSRIPASWRVAPPLPPPRPATSIVV